MTTKYKTLALAWTLTVLAVTGAHASESCRRATPAKSAAKTVKRAVVKHQQIALSNFTLLPMPSPPRVLPSMQASGQAPGEPNQTITPSGSH